VRRIHILEPLLQQPHGPALRHEAVEQAGSSSRSLLNQSLAPFEGQSGAFSSERRQRRTGERGVHREQGEDPPGTRAP
jgi:hypothetical protein